MKGCTICILPQKIRVSFPCHVHNTYIESQWFKGSIHYFVGIVAVRILNDDTDKQAVALHSVNDK